MSAALKNPRIEPSHPLFKNLDPATKNVLDTVPNLKSAYLESLYFEYELNFDANLLYFSLALASGSTSDKDIAFSQLCLCALIQSQSRLSDSGSTRDIQFESKNERCQILLELAQKKPFPRILSLYEQTITKRLQSVYLQSSSTQHQVVTVSGVIDFSQENFDRYCSDNCLEQIIAQRCSLQQLQ